MYALIRISHGSYSQLAGSAGAGSLILEFGLLSRLTGDERFEKAAYKAFFALWNRRSDIGLVGNTVNIRTGVSISKSDTGSCLTTQFYAELATSRSQWYRCRHRLIL